MIGMHIPNLQSALCLGNICTIFSVMQEPYTQNASKALTFSNQSSLMR
jgi:hypothetical protein